MSGIPSRTPPVSLFAPGDRGPFAPLPAAISDYERLDRRSESWAERVRALIDEWFAHLPTAAQESIRPRFMSPRRDAHLGAFHELYQHELAYRSEYDLVDCDIGREDPNHIRPDLLLARGSASCFVEVTVALGDDVVAPDERPRVPQLRDAIDRITNRNFLLYVDLRGVGDATPGRRLTADITRWLDNLDPDRERARVARGGRPATRCFFTSDGWKLIIEASGYKPEVRGRSDLRLVGGWGEGAGGYLNVVEGERRIEFDGPRLLRDDALLAAVLRKKLKHGYQTDDRPFVIAVLCAGVMVNDYDIMEALTGTEGIWPWGNGERYSRLSGVITIAELSPTSVAVAQPTLWTNPAAGRPLAREMFPWRTMEVLRDGSTIEHTATRPVADVLQVSPSFPAA